MRQKRSFFNFGLCRHLLRRFWPVWVLYLCILLVDILTLSASYKGPAWSNSDILGNTGVTLFLSFGFAPIAAACAFSFLYSARGTGMIASLPIHRDTVYTTAFLTGILPMLVSDAVAAFLMSAVTGGIGTVPVRYFIEWFAVAAACNVTFYGFAAFCAVLTGNVIMLPLVYLVLNFVFPAIEIFFKGIMESLIYGFYFGPVITLLLSPLVVISVVLDYKEIGDRIWSITGWPCLIIYAAAGLLLAYFGMLIYRRRRMESATDIVAVNALKPVFKYCMAFGFGAGLPIIFLLVDLSVDSFSSILTLFIIGSFLGYFIAQMLLEKTLRVFRNHWKGFFVFAAIAVALLTCFELDAFGYERYIPDPDRVESVYLSSASADLAEPENIELVTDLHRSYIENKKMNEEYTGYIESVHLLYTLKNGHTVDRQYYVVYGPDGYSTDQALLLQNISNCQEALLQRNTFDENLSPDMIRSCRVSVKVDSITYENVDLSQSQAYELYTQCIVPDIADGSIGLDWIIQPDNYADITSNISIDVRLFKLAEDGSLTDDYGSRRSYNITMEAGRTIAWLKENVNIETVSLRDIQ